MIHSNDKQNQRKHRKMEKRLAAGAINKSCKWFRNWEKRQ